MEGINTPSDAEASALAGIWEREEVARGIARVIDLARDGHGRTLFIVAEAGLGKTTMLDYACRFAEPDVRIGRGRADPMEMWLPFGVVEQAMQTFGGPELLETGTASSPSNSRASRCYRTIRWLEDTSTQPKLLALDDLHWSDPDSLALLAFLCRRIGSLPVAIIATLRPWPRAALEVASALADGGYAALERLQPLSACAASAVIAARLGTPPPETVTKRALELCAGNPLLLEELVAAIARGEALPEPHSGDREAIPTHILLARFAGVPEAGLRLAQGASVFGTAFRPELAAEVARLDDEEVDAALGALCGSGLVQRAGVARAEFVHPLFSHVLYDDLAPPLRARFHARAFRAMASRGIRAEAAAHALRAELVGDAEAIAVLEQVGREALNSGALSTAVAHLERAVAFAGDQASPALTLALGEAFLASGRLDDAVGTYRKLLTASDLPRTTRVCALRMLARGLALQGAHAEAHARFEEAAALVDAADADVAVAVLLDHALASWLTGGPATALPLAARSRGLATQAHPDVARRAEAAWGFLAALSGDPSGLHAVTAAAQPVLEDVLSHVSELFWAWGTLSVFGMAATFAERFADAERAFTRGLSAAERLGAAEAFANLAIPFAAQLTRVGRLDDALTVIGRAGALSDLAPMNQTYVAVGHAHVLWQLGRSEESATWCRRIDLSGLAQGEWMALLHLWDVLGQHRLAEGRVDDACDLYALAQETTDRLGIAEPCAVPWARHAIRAYLAAGRDDEARDVVRWLEDCVQRVPCRWPRVVAAVGHAGLAERLGDHQATETQFRHALSLHDEVDLPLEEGETLLDFAAFVRRRGRLGEARPLLARALRLAEARGAGGLARRAQAELVAAGGRRRRRSPENPLTPQEQRVAHMAAAGLTNREIANRLVVSEGTVETHLGHVYTKLGIHSRSQLTVLAREDEGRRILGDP